MRSFVVLLCALALLAFTGCIAGRTHGQMEAPTFSGGAHAYTEPGVVNVQLDGEQDGWPFKLTVRCDSELNEGLVTYSLPFEVEGAALVRCDSDLGTLVRGDGDAGPDGGGGVLVRAVLEPGRDVLDRREASPASAARANVLGALHRSRLSVDGRRSAPLLPPDPR